jgi:hypothetical protein
MLKRPVRLAWRAVLFLGSVHRVVSLPQSISGTFCKFIPFVTTENNTRTKSGLNGYNQGFVEKEANPSANVISRLFD